MKRLDTKDLASWVKDLSAGEQIRLSGVVYTARDAAHKRIFAALEKGEPLPFPLESSAIYYAGPTPAKNGLAVGSCGPTTSSRMDLYLPRLTDLGLKLTIGKGDRSEEVYEALKRNGAAYLCALGGGGALAAGHILSAEVIAYDDLGCESVKRFVFSEMPLWVGIDCRGNSIFKKL
ncbi:MAG: fumarate hydratase C-terminal domain-containing protein [Clostridia bacterium]|nr:fumarate hydratase C-terminal domain-containing protein [Clostridia bacterium]